MGGGQHLIRRLARASVAADLVATLLVVVCRMGLGVITSLAIIAVGPVVVGMTSTVVMSDSMAPGVRAGDVVVVRPMPAAEVRTGQVLLVDDPDLPGRLRLHRLVGRHDGALVLKGDANPQADAGRVAPRAVHGVGFLRVPWIGLPLLWLRTGQGGFALLSMAAVGSLAAVVALLDPGSSGRAVPLLRRAARRVVRTARSRPAGAGLVCIALTAALLGANGAPTSWAVFSSATAAPGNSVQTGTWACPSLPSATPDIAYSFMAASGTAEPNRPDARAGSSYDATLTSDALRVPGTCASGSSPYLRFSGTGSEALVGNTRLTANNPGTTTIWFSPDAATGLVQDVGSAAGTVVRNADRQLYFTTAGRLAFAMRDGSAVVSCSLSTVVSLRSWHFAAVTYVSQTMTFTLYLDGTADSCSGTLGTAPSGSAFMRVGSDVTIASDASQSAYRGGVDEVGAWSSVLTTAQIDAARANGH